MIGYITGRICDSHAPIVCVLTTNGVGYEVELPLSVFCQLNLQQEVALWTHLVVREDAQILCGFLDKADCDTFKKLIKINGVGTKMALAMLSSMNAGELACAVAADDELALTRIAGVGKKTAQRLLIELKGKLGDVGKPLSTDSSNHNSQIAHEVQSALINLGYKEKEAQNAIKLANQESTYSDMQSLLKASLKCLSGL